jgi:hypothetical protein
MNCILQALESYIDLTLVEAVVMCLTRLQPLLRSVSCWIFYILYWQSALDVSKDVYRIFLPIRRYVVSHRRPCAPYNLIAPFTCTHTVKIAILVDFGSKTYQKSREPQTHGYFADFSVYLKTSDLMWRWIWLWEWIDEWSLSIVCWFLCVGCFIDTAVYLWELWNCSLCQLYLSDRWKIVVIIAAYRPGAPCSLIFILFS